MNFLTILFVFLVAALAVVPILNRLGLSSVIGYLVAGVIIGPGGLALIRDPEGILHFAEIGVVLLLFIIGLELQLKRLWVMRKSVFGLGSLQLAITSMALSLPLWALGLGPVAALLIGFSLALSSTAFVLQLLAEKKQLNHAHGRAAFGVLLFQDLAVIPVIAYLSIAGSGDSSGMNLLVVLAVVAALVIARFLLRPLLRLIARTGIAELFIAASLAIVIGAALAMSVAGLSMGLGAFIAGMMVADSEYRHQMETDIMPFKGLLLGLFFIAVGMSANLRLLFESPGLIIGLCLALITIKVLVLIPLCAWHGLDRKSVLRTAVILSQGGEFAFVLLTVAVSAGMVTTRLMEISVLVVTLSMASTPFLLMGLERLLGKQQDKSEYDDMNAGSRTVIIAGFGRFGQIIGRILTTQRIAFTALDVNPQQVELVREFGNEAFFGDATRLDLLRNAGVADATALVIAIDDVEASIRLAAVLREMFPRLSLFARARNRHHEIRLRNLGVQHVIRDTLLSSLHTTESLLASLGKTSTESAAIVATFRRHDAKTLARQAAVINDDKAFKQTTMEAAQELQQLLLDDQGIVSGKDG